MPAPFEDTSIYQNVIEFVTDTGEKVRAIRCGAGVYDVYRKEGASYARQALVRMRGRGGETPRRVWAAYREALDAQGDDEAPP